MAVQMYRLRPHVTSIELTFEVVANNMEYLRIHDI